MFKIHKKALDNLTGLSTQNTRRKLLKPVVIAAGAGVLLFLAVVFLISPNAFSQFFSGVTPFKPVSPAAIESVKLSAPLGPKIDRLDFRLTGTDTFYRIMSVLKVPGPEIHAIAGKARPIYDLRQLKKDTILRVVTKDDKWERIEYRFNEYEILVVEAADGIKASMSELPHEKKTVVISGTIENSLYEDGLKAGVDPQAIMALSDIFAWDVDFASDIRKGDTFSVLTEVLYVEGRPVKAGRILGAEMVNDGRKYTAVYFAGTDGAGSYFDAEGKSLTRTLLKSPLRFRRITSYFTNRRFHPLLKVYRPHHGIDYAAPTGTPVESSGNGRVIFSGWKNGYGNFIEVKHNNNYITGYGHLSRIVRGIRPGAKVSQGEVIGFVGSTGISTGPHLHYEIRVNSRLINPLSVKSEPDRSITKAELAKFASLRDDVVKKLTGKDTTVASNPVPASAIHNGARISKVSASYTKN